MTLPPRPVVYFTDDHQVCEEQVSVLWEFFRAIQVVEAEVSSFDLHNEAVTQLEKATDRVLHPEKHGFVWSWGHRYGVLMDELRKIHADTGPA